MACAVEGIVRAEVPRGRAFMVTNQISRAGSTHRGGSCGREFRPAILKSESGWLCRRQAPHRPPLARALIRDGAARHPYLLGEHAGASVERPSKARVISCSRV